jgi:hypothetical protein
MKAWEGLTLVLLVGATAVIGCIGTTKYVCIDGSVVSDPGLCPAEEKQEEQPPATVCHTHDDCYANMPAGYDRAECSYYKCYYYSTNDISAPCPSECCLSGGNFDEKKCDEPYTYCETQGGYVGYCKKRT